MNSSDTSVTDLVSLPQTQAAVTELLLTFCDAELHRAGKLHPEYERLWRVIRDQVAAGGKRLRPYLALLSYQAFGGKDLEAMMPVAAAWELLHISMLMHDDIIDRDYVRHGKPNVAGYYQEHYRQFGHEADRLHYAHSAGLLAGDLLISAAFRQVAVSGLIPELKETQSAIFYDAIFAVVGGELLDTEASFVTEPADPLLIAEAKTASYSLVGPLLSGAVAANADLIVEAHLRSLGRILGIGFQLVDDMLGIFGDEKTIGKSVATDLAEAKRTLVLEEALSLMGPSDRERAEALLANPSEANVPELRNLIGATNVRQVIDDRLQEYRAQALGIIGDLPLTLESRSVFQKLVDTLLKRSA